MDYIFHLKIMWFNYQQSFFLIQIFDASKKNKVTLKTIWLKKKVKFAIFFQKKANIYMFHFVNMLYRLSIAVKK